MPMPLGFIHSEETKQKMRLARIGKPKPNFNNAYNPRMLGKKHSEETKKRMSESRKKENHWNWNGGIRGDNKLYLRNWKIKNKEKYTIYQRNHKLRLNYGIDINDYNELLEKQGGTCAICKQYPNKQKHPFSVDHCHNTGRIRGILCSNCNTALGLLKENKDLFFKAIEYLMEK